MRIENIVREIVCQYLNVTSDQIKFETSFVDDLNADSFVLVELLLAVEEAFGIEIPEKEAERLHTFKDAAVYIQAKLPSRGWL